MKGLCESIGNCTMAYMELSGPTLMEVAREAADDGVQHLFVLPLFISAGGHVVEDIPRQAAEAEAALPSLKVEVLPAVGQDPRFRELVQQMGRDVLRITI